MPLKNNMTLAEILMYLTGDLKVSIINDIRPCLSLGYDEGGYFAAPRLVLSYVDYLGALYHGYEGKSDSLSMPKIFYPMYSEGRTTAVKNMVTFFGKSIEMELFISIRRNLLKI